MFTLRNLLLALSICAGACLITNTAAAATAEEVAAAVTRLETELAAATTEAEKEAAKAKAKAAGVPAAKIQRWRCRAKRGSAR